MTGGGPAETIREIKANSAAFFAAQNRAVTREDIVARCSRFRRSSEGLRRSS
jgi:hypothetical protein